MSQTSSNHDRKAWILLGTIIVLVSASALQVIQLRNVVYGDTSTPHRSGVLGAVLPKQIYGWRSQAESLGATEFTTDEARRLLNFDDLFFQSYSQRGREFSLYVGYWRPGRTTVHIIEAHTPDICWLHAGWTRDAAHTTESIFAQLKVGQWRKMRFEKGAIQYVAFWHLVDGHVYSSEFVPGYRSPIAFWTEAVRYGFGVKHEQYFIRLASNVPFEQLEDDPGFQEIVRALAGLGLGAAEQRDMPKR